MAMVSFPGGPTMKRQVIWTGIVSLVWSSALVGAQEVQRFGGETPRMSTRIAFFGQNSSEGQLAIAYGQPEWKAEYEMQFDTLTKGKRWRLGNDFWTTLDTHLDLTMDGVEVASGYYYLVLERSENDDWFLVLLDPKEARSKKLDAFMVDQTTGGIKVPLKWEKTESTTEKLIIKLLPDPDDIAKASLSISWGPHKLETAIDVSL
jgi:hypothetical protein